MMNMVPGQETGPSDFAVINDRDILILDVSACRLQHYKDGEYYETIRLPKDQQFFRLCVVDDIAYVLAGDGILKIDLNTKEQSSVSLPFAADSISVYDSNLFEEDGKLYLVTDAYGNFFLNEQTQTLEKAGANEAYKMSRVGDNIHVAKDNRNWRLYVPDCYGDIIGFDQDGNLYFHLFDTSKRSIDEGFCRILKYAAGEGIKAASNVDPTKYSYIPHCFAKMGSDGNIYVLGLYEEMFIVYRLEVGAEDIREPEMASPVIYFPEELNYTASYTADGKEYTCRFIVSWMPRHTYAGGNSDLVWRGAGYSLEGSGPVYEKLRESIPPQGYLWHVPGDDSGKCYLDIYPERNESRPYIQLEAYESDPWEPLYSQWEDLEFVLRSPAAEGTSLTFKPMNQDGRKQCRTRVLYGTLNDETAGITYYWYRDHFGPKDFAVINDRDILILDVDNMHRIQHFKGGGFFETIGLPEGQEYFRICVIGNDLYVLALDDLLKIDLNTKEQTAFSLPVSGGYMHPGYGVTNMLEWNGKLYLVGGEYYANYCLNEETQKLEKVGKNEPYSIDEDQDRVLTEDQIWDNIDSLNSFSFLIGFDQEENLYFSHFDEPTDPEPEGFCRIVKRAAGGGADSESFVDISKWRYVPQSFVKVGPDGSVYVLGLYDEWFIMYKLNVGVEDIREQ